MTEYVNRAAAPKPGEATYEIVRYYADGSRSQTGKVIKTGLTLEEAQAHCNDPATRDKDWFDGYRREVDAYDEPNEPYPGAWV